MGPPGHGCSDVLLLNQNQPILQILSITSISPRFNSYFMLYVTRTIKDRIIPGHIYRHLLITTRYRNGAKNNVSPKEKFMAASSRSTPLQNTSSYARIRLYPVKRRSPSDPATHNIVGGCISQEILRILKIPEIHAHNFRSTLRIASQLRNCHRWGEMIRD